MARSLTASMRTLITLSYLVAHLAAGAVCVSMIVVVLPLVATMIVAVLANEPGGPLFRPVFTVMLLAGAFATVGAISLRAAVVDLLQRKWGFAGVVAAAGDYVSGHRRPCIEFAA